LHRDLVSDIGLLRGGRVVAGTVGRYISGGRYSHLDNLHRIGKSFELNESPLDVLEALDFARQVNQDVAGEHLASSCQATESRGKVQGGSSKSALHRNGLAGIEPHANLKRSGFPPFQAEPLLQIRGSSQSRPW